jgi:hypothetical protein
MNIEQANNIPLSEILEKIGCRPVKVRGNEIWYLSPFRDEKTASFKIHTEKNVWQDFGLGAGGSFGLEKTGGDVVKFIRYYLMFHNEDCMTADALRWLRNIFPSYSVSSYSYSFPRREEPAEQAPALTLQSVAELKHEGLIDYIERRGIPAGLAKKYVKQAVLHNGNTGNFIYAICLTNEAEGYELRNKFFKGCIGSKNVSVIRGEKTPAQEVHVFEGFIDFLSALALQNKTKLEGDAIILNSVNCLPKAFVYIKDYSYRTVYSWLDNDETGSDATEVLKEFVTAECDLSFKPMNGTYEPQKDVNEFLTEKIKLCRTFDIPTNEGK